MKQLIVNKRIKFSNEDLILMVELKRLKINPSKLIRQAFRDKIKSELPVILKDEAKRKSKEYCPF